MNIYRFIPVLAILVVTIASALPGAKAENLFVDQFGSFPITEYSNTGVKLGTLRTPAGPGMGLGFDPSGNLYQVDYTYGRVYVVNPQGQIRLFADPNPYNSTNFHGAYANGLAVDSTGNVYVALTNLSTIAKITPQGTVTTFATPHAPSGIAIDAANNVYVSDLGTDSILKYTSDGSVSTYASVYYPYGMSFDGGGNLFVASPNGHNITEITPGGVQSIFASGVGNCYDVGFDSKGILYSTDSSSNGSIYRFASDGTRTTFASGLSSPTFFTFGPEITGLVPEAGPTAMASALAAAIIFAFVRRWKLTPANS